MSNTEKSNLSDESGVDIVTASTTTFVEDGAVVSVNHSAPTALSGVEIRDQALKDFMAKPVLIYSYDWNTTDLVNALLPCYTGAATELSVATCLLANTYWAAKIQGFQLVRGTVVFRLVLNASPFQQGRLLMHFLPCKTEIHAKDASYVAMHNATLAGKTQQPCVELDCRDSVAELRIPYVTPSTWYDIKMGNYDWGTLYISVLGQLLVGAGQTATVGYSLYVSFEDFELAAPLRPQAKKGFSSSNGEKAALSEGPVTTGLKVASTIAGALSAVPVLTPFMAPASWVANQLAGIASAFGWSKQTTAAHLQPVVQQPNRYSATCDGPDGAYPLALISDNCLSVLDTGTIYPGDEMSFNFLKTRDALVADIPWTVARSVGFALLVSAPITPTWMYLPGTNTSTTYVSQFEQGPPIYYLAKNHFGLWRGGIEFIFKIVKTDFHTGRLQITFTPTRNTTLTAPDLQTSLLSMREVIDIRSGNEFCLRFPYLHNLNYLKTHQDTVTAGLTTAWGEASGYLDIIVLNELRAPSTVKDEIHILVYARGAEDFELQMPVNMQYPTYSPQMNANFSSGNEALVCETIGNFKDTSFSITHAAECVGESFTSVKQIISRHIPYFVNTQILTLPCFATWPWWRSICYQTAAGLSGPNMSQDGYSCMAPMYVFYRGSVRVQLSPVRTTLGAVVNDHWMVAIAQDLLVAGTALCTSFILRPGNLFESGSLTASWWTLTRVNAGAAPFTLSTTQGETVGVPSNGTVSAVVPYYNRLRMSLGLNCTSTQTVPDELSQPHSALFVSNPNLAMNGGNCSRSFSDDFQLMYFIGCPPVVISSAVP